MSFKIALAGNPNSGKTTLFNALTGQNQFVGNWPGVTVEKKEGYLKGNKDVIITDLPGIYSLSPYTLEEVVSRNYLLDESPDVILNIVDGSNLERNLYLTTQLTETKIPVVVAVNMMDVVEKRGDIIDISKLEEKLGVRIVLISALKGKGIKEAAEAAVLAAKDKAGKHAFSFSSETEKYIEEIILKLPEDIDDNKKRFYAVKLFEKDEKIREKLKNPPDISDIIEKAEEEADDDSESIITNERYDFIAKILKDCYKKKTSTKDTLSDKIDKIVTNRILALPIFALVMWFVYTVSIGTVGDFTVTFMNDGLFGSFKETYETGFLSKLISIPELLDMFLLSADGTPAVAPWLYSLIMDGITGGVGAVLGFVPQMFILFFFLCILEDIGYMARVAFIMDRLFRKFGLSGKSFIPMLVASGCGVPGVMASRTIEQQRDRRMTIMTTCFIPCGAKMPIVGLVASALFGGSALVATSAYFIGIAAVIVSGIILKKTKMFQGEPAPFVMELPGYHIPSAKNVFYGTWERGISFIKRAGSVILLASIIIWLLNSLSFEGGFHYIADGDSKSILNVIGEWIAYLFVPLGFGKWQAAVATVLGLVAKEEVVGVFGSLSSMADASLAFEMVESANTTGLSVIASEFFASSRLSAFSFMVFNLLCAPCFAAMGAIKREMNSAKWTWFAIGYMCVFAYAVSLCVYQIGLLFSGVFSFWTIVAFLIILAFLYFLLRPQGKTGGKL